MRKETFLELVNVCFELGYFRYNGGFYLQIDGTSMGGPASPALANVVMQYVLDKVCENLPFVVICLKLYVDDTFMVIPEDQKDGLLEYFNSVEDKIQFTMEVENEGSLPFLDVMVSREEDGSLSTNWYSKPTSSGRLLNYVSNHPVTQKMSVALGLLHRALSLSDEKHHQSNLVKVREILMNNNYPPAFIDMCINKYNDRKDLARGRVNKYYFKFPFISGVTQSISRCFSNTDWRPASYNLKTIGMLHSQLKDKLEQGIMSELVYGIPCECKKLYVGQTRQWLSNRVYQHRMDCRNINILKLEQTALARHHFDTGHNFIFDKVTILDREKNYLKRNVSEMIHILLNDTVNRKTDTNNLSGLYSGLLELYRKFKTKEKRRLG